MCAPRRIRTASCLLTLCSLVLAQSGQAGLLINEILYDPPGSDAGREFVELYCASPSECKLSGVELRFVNGSDPAGERVVWSGAGGQSVPPWGRFVVGGDGVVERDVERELSLQNGPDALRLRAADGRILDAVAWGELSGLGEGSPAEDVSGLALGRIPDGSDSQDNAADFHALPSSPGRANARAHDFQLLSWELDPPWLDRPRPAGVVLHLLAHGYAPRQELKLRALNGSPAAPTLTFAAARGESLRISWSLPSLGRGAHSLKYQLNSPGELPVELTLPLQVGPTDLVINEIMPRPLTGAPEWVELWNRGPLDLDLEGFGLSDADGAIRGLPPINLSPGEFLLLTADPEASDPPLPLGVQREGLVGGWPTLNNSDRADGSPADVLTLVDVRGAIIDRLAYVGVWLTEAGRGLERGQVDEANPGLWLPAPGAPTPGRANRLAAVPLPPRGTLSISPNPWDPESGEVIHIQLEGEEFNSLKIHDLQGALVRDLGPGPAAALRAHWLWDGRDAQGRPVPWGAYVVRVESADPGRADRRALLAVGGGS